MKCENCGTENKKGKKVCENCGEALHAPIKEEEEESISTDLVQDDNNHSIFIFFGIIFGMLLIAFLFYLIINSMLVDYSKKDQLVCENEDKSGTVTIFYDEDGIVGYNANDFEFSYEDAKEKVKKVGIDQFIDDFTVLFEEEYGGTCTYHSPKK